MKRDKRTIDEILKRYLPSASQEEVESAGAEVLQRLRDDLPDAINKFTLVYRRGVDEPIAEPREFESLREYDWLVLRAVSLLGGEGDIVDVLEKTAELTLKERAPSAVAVALNKLQHLGLIESREDPSNTNRFGETMDRYTITPYGERALAAANLAAEQVRGHLEDLI
jgi:DNA-binding MarR family transcriptional regulator